MHNAIPDKKKKKIKHWRQFAKERKEKKKRELKTGDRNVSSYEFEKRDLEERKVERK